MKVAAPARTVFIRACVRRGLSAIFGSIRTIVTLTPARGGGAPSTRPSSYPKAGSLPCHSNSREVGHNQRAPSQSPGSLSFSPCSLRPVARKRATPMLRTFTVAWLLA